MTRERKIQTDIRPLAGESQKIEWREPRLERKAIPVNERRVLPAGGGR